MGPFHGIRTRQGAELRKRASVFQRSTRGPQARSGSGRRQPHATSLIAHHRIDRLPAMGAFLFWAHRRGIRTRQGAELRKREAFSSAAREERSDEAGRGRRRPHADIPHRPPLNWKRSSQGDRFCLRPSQGDSNPPARLSQRPWSKNGKNEYCYFACNI